MYNNVLYRHNLTLPNIVLFLLIEFLSINSESLSNMRIKRFHDACCNLSQTISRKMSNLRKTRFFTQLCQ